VEGCYFVIGNKHTWKGMGGVNEGALELIRRQGCGHVGQKKAERLERWQQRPIHHLNEIFCRIRSIFLCFKDVFLPFCESGELRLSAWLVILHKGNQSSFRRSSSEPYIVEAIWNRLLALRSSRSPHNALGKAPGV